MKEIDMRGTSLDEIILVMEYEQWATLEKGLPLGAVKDSKLAGIIQIKRI